MRDERLALNNAVVDARFVSRSLNVVKRSRSVLSLKNWIDSADVSSNVGIVGITGGRTTSSAQLTASHAMLTISNSACDGRIFSYADFPLLAQHAVADLRRQVEEIFEFVGATMPMPSSIAIDAGLAQHAHCTTRCVENGDALTANEYFQQSLRYLVGDGAIDASRLMRVKQCVKMIGQMLTSLYACMWLFSSNPTRSTEFLNVTLGSTLPGGRVSSVFALPIESIGLCGLNGGVDSIATVFPSDSGECDTAWSRSSVFEQQLSSTQRQELFVWTRSAKQAATRDNKSGAEEALGSTVQTRLLPPHLADIVKLYAHCLRSLHENLVVLSRLSRLRLLDKASVDAANRRKGE